MSKCDHRFTVLAPEASDPGGEMWEWCVLCGQPLSVEAASHTTVADERTVQMSKCDHRFTVLAPETGDPGGEMWEWCVLCGKLRLGSQTFTPGSHQQAAILSDREMEESNG